ncbi:MAG: response regulator [Bacteroidia bacterium]
MKQNKIFIVEDNFLYSYVLEEKLSDSGNFKITTFSSAEECIQMLGNSPDIIILDYNLEKGMNGLEAFKIIHEKNPKVKIIILSGQKDAQVTAELLQNGVFDYIEKKNHEQAMQKLHDSILRAFGIASK